MKKLLATFLLALGFSVPNAALAANPDDVSFWFKNESRRTVVLYAEGLGSIEVGQAFGRLPQSCRGNRVLALRNQFGSRYRRTSVQDYSAIRRVLVRSNNEGSQWAGVSGNYCGRGLLLVCVRAVGGSACGVVRLQ